MSWRPVAKRESGSRRSETAFLRKLLSVLRFCHGLSGSRNCTGNGGRKQQTLMNETKGEITRLLNRWSNGDESAFEQLMSIVYEELKAFAGYYLRMETSGHTLQSTALVHELYLRLVEQTDM